jgi:hypothetical protein
MHVDEQIEHSPPPPPRCISRRAVQIASSAEFHAALESRPF